ncbi:MAG: four helix bundle protein [Thermoanaerobaculia bacterium]
MSFDYRDLKAWQLGMQMARRVYEITRDFPKREQYGLTQQIQKAAVSVPSNIAEGHARDSTADFLRHLSISRGSLAELETQLILAKAFGYLPLQSLEELMKVSDELSRTLRGLQKSLRRRLEKKP